MKKTVGEIMVGSVVAACVTLNGAEAAPKTGGAGDWEQQLKRPVDWMEWGADFRFRDEGTINATTLQDGSANSEANYLRLRGRVWTYLTPVPDWTLDLRFISEPRYYFQPANTQGWSYDEGLFDHCMIRTTNLFGQPLAVTVGRQEFNFGNKWLIWDASSTDGSRSEYFDAARITFDAADLKTIFDAIYIQQDAQTESWLPVWNETRRFIDEQDERGAILYARNRSLANTQLDGYGIYRHQEAAGASGNSGDIGLVGARVEGTLTKHWQYRAEFGYEFGRLKLGTAPTADLRAWGWNQMVTYNVGDDWKSKFRLGYEYLSGDDPNTAVNEGWDPMWARRAQWSELMVLLFSAENRTRAGDYKNLQRPSIGATTSPVKNLELSLDYSPLFANENPTSTTPAGFYSHDGFFRGHYVQSIARYTFDKHWSGLLQGEFFVPGNYYSSAHQDLAVFYRAEIGYKF